MTKPRTYRMSYTLIPGPGKTEAERRHEEEGLTDYLVVVSVLGTPGDGTLNVLPMAVGPEGREASIHPAIGLALAMAMLTRFPDDHPTLSEPVARALAILRMPFQTP